MTLYRSLSKHCKNPFRFYVLCLDEDALNALKKLDEESIVPITLQDVEQWDQALLTAKRNRSRIEYYFTLSPVLPLYVLEHFDVDIVTYLDADLMFFSSPDPIYEELGKCSVFVTEHRFSEKLQDSIKFGRFNVQCQAFRNDETGLACLYHWREQCLDWCYDRLEDEKFADQKYLDEWPDLYGENLVICQHRGVGLAPWNVGDASMERVNDDFLIDGERLVFYHFHDLKILGSHLIRTGLGSYQVRLRSGLRDLYVIYMEGMRKSKTTFGAGSMDKSIRVGHGRLRILRQGIKQRDLLWL